MIFQHTWEKVLSGEKVQTRRLMKPSHFVWFGDDSITRARHEVVAVKDENNKCRDMYRVGKTYAVQPGRGQKAVGRIRLLNIDLHDVRNMASADVKAEGFTSFYEFMSTWCAMHDKEMTLPTEHTNWSLQQHLHKHGQRDRYQAWVLTFELVERQCGNCDGQGIKWCHTRGGLRSAYYQQPYHHITSCKTCNRAGKITCRICNGTGTEQIKEQS